MVYSVKQNLFSYDKPSRYAPCERVNSLIYIHKNTKDFPVRNFKKSLQVQQHRV